MTAPHPPRRPLSPPPDTPTPEKRAPLICTLCAQGEHHPGEYHEAVILHRPGPRSLEVWVDEEPTELYENGEEDELEDDGYALEVKQPEISLTIFKLGDIELTPKECLTLAQALTYAATYALARTTTACPLCRWPAKLNRFGSCDSCTR